MLYNIKHIPLLTPNMTNLQEYLCSMWVGSQYLWDLLEVRKSEKIKLTTTAMSRRKFSKTICSKICAIIILMHCVITHCVITQHAFFLSLLAAAT